MTDPTDLIRRGDAIAWCEEQHRIWARSLGRDPEKYVGKYSFAIDVIRELPAAAVQEPVAWLQRHQLGPLHLSGEGEVGIGDWSDAFPVYAHPVQEPPSPGVTAGATGEWDTQRVALSIAAMVEEWYDGGWRDHLPFHLIEKRLNRYATPAPVVPAEGLEDYDAGLLNDFGGGDVGWWQDYLRAEIGRANDFWRDQVSALRSAPPVGARVTGWQPIETAPRDGTPVDLWCLNLLHHAKKGFRKTNVSWGTVTDWLGTEREDWRHGFGEGIQPTHWMPLPEPPAALLPAGEGRQ